MSTRLISQAEVKAKGVPLSRVQFWRLELAGKFPKRVRISDARFAYVESEIDAYIAQKIAERDKAQAVA